jgi:3-methyladenine DNA glycosylase AlkD
VKEQDSSVFSAATAAKLLWSYNGCVYEHRLSAVKMLRMEVKSLNVNDLEMIETFLDESGTWALIDELATHVASPVVFKQADPQLVLTKWSKHTNFWVRRSCLLVHLLPLRNGDESYVYFVCFVICLVVKKYIYYLQFF